MRRALWVMGLAALLVGACSSDDRSESLAAGDGGGTDPAAGPVMVWCGEGPAFSSAALDGPDDAEGRDDAVGDALRAAIAEGSPVIAAFPTTGWHTLVEDDTVVFLGTGEAPSLTVVELEPDGDGWAPSWVGGCGTRAYREGVETAMWEPDEPLDPGSADVQLLVTESACTGGEDPGDRLQPAEVVEDDDTVTVTFWIEPLGDGFHTCAGSLGTPVIVTLDAPLGGRALLDGGIYPAGVVRPGDGTGPTPTADAGPGSSSVPADPAAPESTQTTGPAPADVEPSGPLPADEERAIDDIEEAFHTAFDAGVPEQERFAAVEDGPALAEAGREAAAQFPDAAASITVEVHDITFVDATRAAVTFELFYERAMPLGPQDGEAVLVDGAWKVSRETRCAIIRQAGVECP